MAWFALLASYRPAHRPGRASDGYHDEQLLVGSFPKHDDSDLSPIW